MTPTGIHCLLYDLLRVGKSNEEITESLQERGATYADLVAALIEHEG